MPTTNNSASIVVVEDNAADQEMVRRSLRDSPRQMSLTILPDGESAIEFLFPEQAAKEDSSAPPRIGCLLLDVNLPGLSGKQVLQRIRSEPRFDHVPVIMFTTCQADAEIERCYRLGCNSYVIKPTGLAEFMATLQSTVEYWTVLNKRPATTGG